jgi:hypothetical protein
VHLIEDAHVLSDSAALTDTLGQRRRWEHGFLDTALKEALPLLLHGLRVRSKNQISLALHLCVPPLALLLFLAITLALAAASIAVLTGMWAPAALLVVSLAVALGLTLRAWWVEGRRTLTPLALARAPLYIVQKLPVYADFITSRHSTWNRTRRSGEPD